MKVYNNKGEEINLINYTKENKDIPYDAEWTVREESYSDNKIVQWATKSDGKETYKRSCVNDVWTDWLLVEGERLLWEGQLSKGQSVTIQRLSFYKKFRVYVSNVGYVELDGNTSGQYGGLSVVSAGNEMVINLIVCNVNLSAGAFGNALCITRPLTAIQTPTTTYQKITQIIGIP